MDLTLERQDLTVRVIASKGAILPNYQTEGSAGADLHAYLAAPVLIEPGQRLLVPTGLQLELPNGYEAQVRPRSGLALKHGLTVLNAPGTIDSDYRGEVQVLLINHGADTYTVQPGERIAQLVLAPVSHAVYTAVSELSPTTRGAGGYGHTGC